MPELNEIERAEIQSIVSAYDTKKVKIGIFGSHSALPTGYAAKRAGFLTVLLVKKGRGDPYVKHNRALFDEVIQLSDWKDILSDDNQVKLRKENVIFIPNRSFVVYTGLDEIESQFRVPIYGSRSLLRAEERTTEPPRNQYYLLEKAGVRTPKLFKDPKKIDRLTVVKVQQKDNPLERAYFYPSNPEEYEEMSRQKIEAGDISQEGLEKATIEEFVVGPMLNANFHSYALNLSESREKFDTDIDLLGFSDREQTNETGYRSLPANLQLKLAETGFKRTNEEICHKGKTLRESKLAMIYQNAEQLVETLKEEVPPGMIGPIGIQGAIPVDEKDKPEFVVFDLSFRVPGDPAMGPTSPYLKYLDVKHESTYKKFMPENWKIEGTMDLTMMEIKRAANLGKLEEIVT